MTTHDNHASIEENFNMQVQVTARVTATFAWQHLKAATIFRDHVIEVEIKNAGQPFGPFFEELRSYASGCIMSAAASLEALINELFISPHCGLRPMLKDFESEFWGRGGIERKPMLEKYQLALKMLGKSPLDVHAQPYRDAWALNELRNALVHFKPIWDPERQQKVELAEILAGKYDVSPFLNENSDFVTMQSMSASCARWVVSTTFSFMREFDNRTNIDENMMPIFWKLET
jgi:hypothetical protein